MSPARLRSPREPRCECFDPGGSDSEGELLNDLHAFDTIAESWSKPAALGELSFTFGSGTADRMMRFTATPPQLAAALAGATYTPSYLVNDTVTFLVGDPAGSELLPPRGVSALRVTATPSTRDPNELVNSQAVVAMWAAIVALIVANTCALALMRVGQVGDSIHVVSTL